MYNQELNSTLAAYQLSMFHSVQINAIPKQSQSALFEADHLGIFRVLTIFVLAGLELLPTQGQFFNVQLLRFDAHFF